MDQLIKEYGPPLIILGAFVTLLIYVALGSIFSAINSEPSDQTELTETYATVELYFGNGETYQFKAKTVVPSYGTPIAVLENNYKWRFAEAYKYEYDSETNTYKVFLWRDEPYKLEKECFEKIN